MVELGMVASLGHGITWLLTYVIPFLFVLTLVVFFHELGHFLVARWCGVKVETFSIGFGRSLLSWKDRKGTVWKIGWLPFGGYVKWLGDEDAASRPDRAVLASLSPSDREGSFHHKSVLQRSLVIAAGPVANFLLAIVIFALLFSIVGEQRVAPRIGVVSPQSAAEEAGFKPGDLVLSINDKDIETFTDIQEITSESAGKTLTVRVARGSEERVLSATPKASEVKDRLGNVHRIGLLGLQPRKLPEDLSYVRYDPFTGFVKAVDNTGFIIGRTLGFVGGLFLGREDASQLSGPLGIANIAGQVAQFGLVPLLNLVAVLSISIGLLNLFPIPMLDGGHLLYNAYEAVRGRPLGERAQELGFRIGLAFVLFLMIFATWNDLSKLQIFG